MNREMIKQLALANGFKLKKQPDGTEDLNPYVYEFAAALEVKVLTCFVSDTVDTGQLSWSDSQWLEDWRDEWKEQGGAA